MRHIIIAAAAALAAGGASPALAGTNTPTKPIEIKYHANGPWAVATVATPAGCDGAGNVCDIYYPADLGKNGYRHPIVAWANGTGETPVSPAPYAYYLRHLASWGFVVIATRNGQTGYGDPVVASIAYLKARNADAASPFYNKLATARVGTAGHSQGATGAINAMLKANAASPGAVRTAVSFHIARQSFCNPADLCLLTKDLTAAKSGSILYVSGTGDPIISPDQQMGGDKLDSNTAYYNATPTPLLKAKAMLKGPGLLDAGPSHNDVQGNPTCAGASSFCNNGVDGYLGYPTAWLMWQLADATDGRDAFKASGGEIFSETTNWKSVLSNVP